MADDACLSVGEALIALLQAVKRINANQPVHRLERDLTSESDILELIRSAYLHSDYSVSLEFVVVLLRCEPSLMRYEWAAIDQP